ncbi:MAG: ADP-ribosylglycohydrolase family protein [Candidatus Sumerlaeia bacterium]|nr:ADP-ribosylglycohydrolase family protein [Candidatus Sumerlaeia bacterium]
MRFETPPADSRRAAITGSMLLGDVLGYPLAGIRQGHVQQLAGVVAGPLADGNLLTDRPDRYREAGLHSALGQTALAVAATAGQDELGRDEVARVASALLELAGPDEATPGALRWPGRPLRAAVKQWREDYPWERGDFLTGRRGSKGASCAAAALAAAATGWPAGDERTRDLMRLTHHRQLPLAAGFAVARCAELLLAEADGARFDRAALLERLRSDCAEYERQLVREYGAGWREAEWEPPARPFAEALAPLASLLREGNDTLAVNTILGGIGDFGPDSPVTHPMHGFAAACVPWTLYLALGERPPGLALETAVNLGGETALVCALLAGLLAARYGRALFPEEWWKSVKALAEARRLLALPSAENAAAWLDAERSWSAREAARRAELLKALPPEKRAPPPRKRADEAGIELPPDLAPPPEVWMRDTDEMDPWEKARFKEARGRRRIGWKEERRDRSREGEPFEDED